MLLTLLPIILFVALTYYGLELYKFIRRIERLFVHGDKIFGPKRIPIVGNMNQLPRDPFGIVFF